MKLIGLRHRTAKPVGGSGWKWHLYGLFIWALVTVVPIHPAVAEEVLILCEEVDVPFTPQAAVFYVNLDRSEAVAVPGAAIAAPEARGGAAVSGNVCTALMVPAGLVELEYHLLLEGSPGEIRFVPQRAVNRQENPAAWTMPERLRDEILIGRSELNQRQSVVRQQEQELRRLRADAALVGERSKLLALLERMENHQQQRQNLNRHIQGLERLLEIITTLPEPKNFLVRQNLLTPQVGELAAAARQAEAQEQQRKQQGDYDVAQQQALITAVGGARPDLLENELHNLRIQRQALEARLGRSVPEREPPPLSPLDDYQLQDLR